MIVISMAFTTMPLVSYATTDDEFDYWADDVGTYIEDLGGHKAKTQAIIDYVVTTYGKNDQRYKGKGQCYGYAEKIRRMFGTRSKTKKLNVKPTTSNIWKYIKNCKPGTHVRFSQKKNGRGYCHSVVILKVSRNRVWTTDGNIDWKNGIRVSCCTPADFAYWARSYGYIAWIKQPKGSPTKVKKISPKAVCSTAGKVHVSWRPVKKAKKYVIYRSTSKNSGYKKIATVKSSRYVDKYAPVGTVYYKIKAKGKMSKAVSATRKAPATETQTQ